MTEISQQTIQNNATKKKGLGCWAIGCITVVIVVVLLLILGYFGLKKVFTGAIEKYSTTESISLPAVNVSQQEYEAVTAKLTSLNQDGGPNEVVINSGELSALLKFHPDMKKFGEHASLQIAGDVIQGQFNLPLDFLGYSGRFFNGQGKISVSMEKDVWTFRPHDVVANGQPVGQQILDRFTETGPLNPDTVDDPEMRELLHRLESVRVKDGHIIIRRKR